MLAQQLDPSKQTHRIIDGDLAGLPNVAADFVAKVKGTIEFGCVLFDACVV